ncbi:hypothetical protein SH528x_002318 [Novipirellula sp. SH528]|uniref:hypothetical protein n=1 Tax=Novipirellula sp. SH528 TaxID=3454466 RepID=UPI003F9F6BBB
MGDEIVDWQSARTQAHTFLVSGSCSGNSTYNHCFRRLRTLVVQADAAYERDDNSCVIRGDESRQI